MPRRKTDAMEEEEDSVLPPECLERLEIRRGGGGRGGGRGEERFIQSKAMNVSWTMHDSFRFHVFFHNSSTHLDGLQYLRLSLSAQFVFPVWSHVTDTSLCRLITWTASTACRT